MKFPFYNIWFRKRLKKVVDVLGEDWFVGKSILELGAAHGDFGLEFIKMGSRVTFCDARIQHLESIKQKLDNDFPNLDGSDENSFVNLVQLDQNHPYAFNYKYDLVIHFGLLYHIENWKQDLKCALETSDCMFLETIVYPDLNEGCLVPTDFEDEYCAYKSMSPIFLEKEVEEVLNSCGAKFIRFDSKDLNHSGWCSKEHFVYHVYDWNLKNYTTYFPDNEKSHVQFRRFWLVLK